MQGITKSESGLYPVILPGEKQPVSSAKIEEYLNNGFWHYYNIYTKHKHLGSPYEGGWTEYPEWYCQLIVNFDSVIDFIRAHNEREAYRNIGIK